MRAEQIAMTAPMDLDLARWLAESAPLAPALDIASPDPTTAARAMRAKTHVTPPPSDPALVVSPVMVRLYRPVQAIRAAVIMSSMAGAGCWAMSTATTPAAGSWRSTPAAPWPQSGIGRLPSTVSPPPATIASPPPCGCMSTAPCSAPAQGRWPYAGRAPAATSPPSVALRLRDQSRDQLRMQMLIYPVCDHRMDTRSDRENSNVYPLPVREISWFWDQYAPDPASRAEPYVSVADAPSCAGLPSTDVITADLDPLRDGGAGYAGKLAAAGVAVWLENMGDGPRLLVGGATPSPLGGDAKADRRSPGRSPGALSRARRTSQRPVSTISGR
jgi:acetyl esterase